MGCCLTTTAVAADHQLGDSKKPRDAPPPALAFEEETVKEVLSETPVISKKPPPSNSTPNKITSDNQQILHPEEEFRSGNGVVQLTKNVIEENASEVSSEMYSCSKSFSAATTTTSLATDLKRGEIEIDEDGEVTQKVNKPPPAKRVPRRHPTTSSAERARRKERGIRPPAPAPAPARRSAVPSTDKKSQLPSRNITTAQRHRNVGPSNIVRREPPARRSRSPAMRGEAGQVRKVKDRSPVRKSVNSEPVKATEIEENVKLKKTNDGGVLPEPETSESLENPLVSLECFIFL